MTKPSRIKFIPFDTNVGEFAAEHKLIYDDMQQANLPCRVLDVQEAIAYYDSASAKLVQSPLSQARGILRASVEQYVHYLPQAYVEPVSEDYRQGSDYNRIQSHFGYLGGLINGLFARNLPLTDDDFAALLAFIVKCPNLHPGAAPSSRLVTLIRRRFAGKPVPDSLRAPMLAFAKALNSYRDNPCHRLGVELNQIVNGTSAPQPSHAATTTVPTEESRQSELKFKSGPVLNATDIQKLKSLVGFPLPESYERFLLATNGRSYNHDVILKNSAGKRLTGSSIRLYTLSQAIEEYEQRRTETGNQTFPRYVFPVGDVGGGSLGTLFLCLCDWRHGDVWNIDWGHEGTPLQPAGDPDIENPMLIGECHGRYSVAQDFQQLLDAITPDRSGGYRGHPGGKSSEKLGQKLTQTTLSAAQANHAIKLPDDYAAYLLKSNGGGLDENTITYLGHPKRQALIYWLLPFTDPQPGYASALECARSLGKHCGLPSTLLPIGNVADNNILLLSLDPAAFGHVYVVGWQHIRKTPELWKRVENHPRDTRNLTLWETLEADHKVADSFSQAAQTLKPRL